MRSSYRYTIIYFAIVILFFSCNKNDENPTDSRDKYIGQYAVWHIINKNGPIEKCGENYYLKNDTIINVSYGETDTTLNILGRDVYLDSLGWFNTEYFNLKLWDKDISIYIENKTSIWCTTYQEYQGHRI